MKKIIAALLIATLTLTGFAALAETQYDREDIAFTYDESAFEIEVDDVTDDEHLVILAGKNPDWGNVGIRFYLGDVEEGDTLPTLEDFKQMPGAEATQGEWNGWQDVFMYTVDYEDAVESVFVVPVKDDDGEVDALLTVGIVVDRIEDEETAMARDDMISAVIDTLRVDD